MAQQRLDYGLKIILVHPIDLCSELKWDANLLRNFDCPIDSFLGRNPPQKSKISSRFVAKLIHVCWQTVVHRGLPVRPRQRLSLAIRNRDHRHLSKFLVKRNQIRKIEPAVQCGYMRYLLTTAQGKVQVISMKMDDVELRSALHDVFQHQHVVRQPVHAVLVHTQ